MKNASVFLKSTLLISISILFTTGLHATRYYIKPVASGSGNGSSWANASGNLCSVLLSCVNGDEVWVAAGVYYPTADLSGNTNTADPRNKLFYILPGVKLYGGFAGTETQLSQRNYILNKSVLDGDIGVSGNAADNCYHVVLAGTFGSTGITLDGCSIRNGNANVFSSTTINGENIYNANAGGIILRNGNSSIVNCTIENNYAGNNGGGIWIAGSGTISFNNNIIRENTAVFWGGGLYNEGNGNVTVGNNIFISNTANEGGGVFHYFRQANYTNNTFVNNNATTNGGALYLGYSQGTNVFSNNIFWGNKKAANASQQGADYHRESGDPNSALFRNNLLQLPSGNYTTTGNGNYDLGSSASGNIFNTNPQFFDSNNPAGSDNLYRTADDGLAVLCNSPCMSGGNNSLVPASVATDITGKDRILGGTVEIGAYEFASRIYVNAAATTLPGTTGLGSSWNLAYPSLADALQAINSCNGINEIWVAAGTYKPAFAYPGISSPADNREKTFYIPAGIQLFGGFAGTETALTERVLSANETILSGDLGITGNTTDNAYHVVVTNPVRATISGFTIRDGNANGSGAAIIDGVNVFRNTGGGLYLLHGTNQVSYNVISANTAFDGAGIRTSFGNNTFIYNFISENTAVGDGGGIYSTGGSVQFANNIVGKNSCGRWGGGYFNYQSQATLSNNSFVSNAVQTGTGGAFHTYQSNNLVFNNIFWNNTLGGSAAVPGADYYNTASATANSFKNNLLQLASGNYTNTNLQYGLGTDAANNLFAADPAFRDINNFAGPDNRFRTSDDGLRPGCASSVIDMGDDNLVLSGITADIAGFNRIMGTAVDLGAYEFSSRAYVNAASATAPGTPGIGSSWQLAYASLSDALEAARQCAGIREIWVAAGIYQPALAYPGNSNPANPRDRTFYITNSLKLYGGFSGTESTLAQRRYITNETILDGNIGTAGNNTDNSYHVLTAINCTATIDGFTIRNGNANGTSFTPFGTNSVPQNGGGGILLSGCTSTIENNILKNNVGTEGAGISCRNGTGTIAKNIFSANLSSQRGGGCAGVNSSLTLANNLFVQNRGTTGGGAIGLSNVVVNTAGNTFYQNLAPGGDGGALWLFNGSGQFSNNIFWQNSSNALTDIAGADYYRVPGTANNYVFSNNLLQLPAGLYSTSATGSNNLGTTATGNIFSTNPIFFMPATPAGNDATWRTDDDGLIPEACSPAYNMGNNSLIPAGQTSDVMGLPRTQYFTTDMGCYEVRYNTPNQSAAIANSNMSVTRSQLAGGYAFYTNDCSSLVATIQSGGASPVSGNTTARVWIEPAQPAGFVKRHYEISPASNPATATGRITLYFTQQDFDSYNAQNLIQLPVDGNDLAGDKANLRIQKRGGTSNNGTGLPGTYTGAITTIDPDDAAIIWNSANNRWEVSFDVTGFSGFFVTTASSTLPVNWISFSGNLNASQQAVLSWLVEEHNVSGYEVEKSMDGTNFTGIGAVTGLGDGQHSYLFTEATPLSSTAYYRIKQTDRDGRYTYSTIIRLQQYASETLQVYPNPFTSTLQVYSSNAQIIQLHDISGRLIQSFPVNAGTTTVNLAQLARGMYVLKTSRGESTKLLKN